VETFHFKITTKQNIGKEMANVFYFICCVTFYRYYATLLEKWRHFVSPKTLLCFRVRIRVRVRT